MIVTVLLSCLLSFSNVGDSPIKKQYQVLYEDLVMTRVYEGDRLKQMGTMILTDGDVWRYHGRWKQWDEKGRLRFEVVFDYGKRQKVVHYRKDGRVVRIEY